jgi:hypothetical protein
VIAATGSRIAHHVKKPKAEKKVVAKATDTAAIDLTDSDWRWATWRSLPPLPAREPAQFEEMMRERDLRFRLPGRLEGPLDLGGEVARQPARKVRRLDLGDLREGRRDGRELSMEQCGDELLVDAIAKREGHDAVSLRALASPVHRQRSNSPERRGWRASSERTRVRRTHVAGLFHGA